MRKPVVGETLYSLNVGNAARRTPQVLTPVVVTKVGHKYFTVGQGCAERQFHISDWTQKTEYTADAKLYESKQEWDDEKEIAQLCAELCKAFEYGHNKRKLTLDTVRQMHRLLTIEIDVCPDYQLQLSEIAFRAILRDPAWVSEILDVDNAAVRKLFDKLNQELNPECAGEFVLETPQQ